ncbi:pyridoxal phosphate-dependent decarboxylase family protein [Haloprofundus salinisoli]|uniref:pyridoxal phosphate-dependent decarboxylase family protein n=1 Tax=Haloprofundus salinisoli TaxID=2876193 RepID=UPI001CCE31A9|nr:aspartate aminotransferase family protein [Haloprofundus salinisoli]
MNRAAAAVRAAVSEAESPYAGSEYDDLAAAFDDFDPVPERGDGLDAAVEWAADAVLANSALVSHPKCVAHLQCPPLVSGLVAEALLTAVNQSMDSWDQSPAATVLEEAMIEELCALFGYDTTDDDTSAGGDAVAGDDATADGVFTSGGTQSNFLGLLLARDRYVHEAWGRRAQTEGLPPEADSLRILCSEVGHFTAEQAAAHLGLGENAVVPVSTDDEFRVDPGALSATLDGLEADGKRPFALVGTAGTTDFGSIDPLDALADCADEHDLWFHVDAAFGGALALSDRHRDKLAGIERADSLAVDFHKLFYQPISCGAFLLRDGANYRYIARNEAYLNPERDDKAGVPNLVSKSVQTTRRFDALKPLVTFRALGREGVAELVEYTLDLADEVAARIAADPAFELVTEPTLNAVVFRYVPFRDHPTLDDGAWSDRVNRQVRRTLLHRGRGVVARTEVDGRVHLKFTLLNPNTTPADVDDLLVNVKQYGAAAESEAVE